MAKETSLTPAEYRAGMEMFISLMHMRKVTLDFWVDTITDAMRGVELTLQCEVEGRMLRTPDLPEGVVATLKSAMELSLKELSASRGVIRGKLELLKKCPMPGVTLH